MINFKKYNSVENVETDDFLGRVLAEVPSDREWVVQEKVHGANASFLFDGSELECAKRTAVLTGNDKFYGLQDIMREYEPKIRSLYARIVAKYPTVEMVQVFGEVFGGRYAHEEVAAVKGTTLVQKGVNYAPWNGFYAFDIYVKEGGEGRYLPVDEADELFEAEGFFYARTLLRGTLAECLKYPNAFQSHIPEWLGLPAIADNICEGVVIRPVEPTFLRNGSRVLLKSKNERFSEKGKKVRNKLFEEKSELSEALKALAEEASAYVTENRLNNVVSHIGEVSYPRDFGRVTGMLAKDALDDFLKDRGDAYSALDKNEQKQLNRELNQLAASLVKRVAAGA